MKEYKVTWEIELEATSAQEAANLALEIHRDPDSLATTFWVGLVQPWFLYEAQIDNKVNDDE